MPARSAMVAFESGAVGCVCPDTLLHVLREAFGPDLECDGVDQLAGHGERTARNAAALGIPRDSPAVLSAIRNERQFGPRYVLRLRVGSEGSVAGRLDRQGICVVCDSETDFPEPARGKFVEFLRLLQLGKVQVDS